MRVGTFPSFPPDSSEFGYKMNAMQPFAHAHPAAVGFVASYGVSQSGKASSNKIMRLSGQKRGDGEGSMKGKAGDG